MDALLHSSLACVAKGLAQVQSQLPSLVVTTSSLLSCAIPAGVPIPERMAILSAYNYPPVWLEVHDAGS